MIGGSFDFRGDSLVIYDGGSNTSPMLGNPYCGDSLPPSQISSSNGLFIHFQSNYMITRTGFKLEYNATSKNPNKIDNFEIVFVSRLPVKVPIIFYICNCLVVYFLWLVPGCDKFSLVGNGFCNDDTNNVDCNYDGGDCCVVNANTNSCSICGCHFIETCLAGYHPFIEKWINSLKLHKHNYLFLLYDRNVALGMQMLHWESKQRWQVLLLFSKILWSS